MKKLLLTGIAVLLLATGAAHARPFLETYECGATKPLEYEADPIVKIIMRIAVSARSGDVHIFDVDHYAASGKVWGDDENRRAICYDSSGPVETKLGWGR